MKSSRDAFIDWGIYFLCFLGLAFAGAKFLLVIILYLAIYDFISKRR